MKSAAKLLRERQFKDVTVTDIVSDCGVNRNSFYYHFDDIQGMLNYMIRDEISTLLGTHYDERNSYACLERCCETMYNNRETILNIYDGDKAVLMNCLDTAAGCLTELYTAKQKYSQWLPPEEYQLVVHVFKCCVVGLVENCLNNRFDEQSCSMLKAACRKLTYLPYEKDR